MFREDKIPQRISLDDVGTIEMWALAGLAALARRNGGAALEVVNSRVNEAGRFASAVGFEDVIFGVAPDGLGEAGRTIKLQRIRDIQDVEGVARRIVDLMLPASEEDETRSTLLYVLVELMRNAVQHSRDPKGGIVAAQLMKAGYAGYPRAVVQVAVADAGIGILEALRASHPEPIGNMNTFKLLYGKFT
jgi:signal transduction histidine kinase